MNSETVQYILVAIFFLILAAWVVYRQIRRRKQRTKSDCHCGCSGCPTADLCNRPDKGQHYPSRKP